jgi:phosphohistidine phosphatase
MKRNKILHVVRHAKSSWDNDGIGDIDRPLKPKGIRTAYEIARKMKLNSLIPELIISSPANRALHTAVIFARVFDISMSKLQVSNTFYESSADQIIKTIKTTDDHISSLMIFGHNPDFSELVRVFLKHEVGDLPTSGAVTLKFNTDSWHEINLDKLDSYVINFPEREV